MVMFEPHLKLTEVIFHLRYTFKGRPFRGRWESKRKFLSNS